MLNNDAMAVMDPATKEVTLEPSFLQDLDPHQEDQARKAAALVNRLMAELVAMSGEYPSAPTNLSSNVSKACAKFREGAVTNVQRKQLQEAVKMANLAVETALRRPLWESFAYVIEELAQCLMVRTDVNIQAQNWSDAYADVCMLMTIKPQDPGNHMRRAATLVTAGQLEEAELSMRTAASLAPANTVIKTELGRLLEMKQKLMRQA